MLIYLGHSGESETDENPWEFDTVRGRSFDASGLGTPQATSSEDQASATVKQQSSKLPTSLRHLFDTDVTSAPDPFRIPGFNAASKDVASSLPGSPVVPSSHATPVMRDRAARRALRVENSLEDGPNLSTATFAFPPRTITRATKSKAGVDLSPSDDQANSASPYPWHADKPSTLLSSSPAETMGTGSNTPVPAFVASKLPGRRELRLDSSDPDLESSPQGSGPEMKLLTTANEDGPSADARLAPALSRRSPASRNRTQSTAQVLPPTPVHEQNPPLPSDFHFPQHSASSDPNQSASSGPGFRPRARMSPTRANAPKTQLSLHSPAHSLDARISSGYPLRPSPPTLVPPALGRSRSATPADDAYQETHAGPHPGGLKSQQRPSLHRLASLPVIETPPTVPSTKPISKSARGRSGNSAGGVGDLSGIPDLKDVLKASLPRSHFFTLTNTVLSLPHLPLNINSGCPIYYLPPRRHCIRTSNPSRLPQVTLTPLSYLQASLIRQA
jgi:protein-serine/threonine kinase